MAVQPFLFTAVRPGGVEVPEWLAGVRAGNGQGAAGQAAAHPAPDLDQMQAQGAELQVGHLEPGQPAPEGVEQPVGRGVQQRADRLALLSH
ncbi:MAG: hypothetical protein JWO59_423 [Chloroflexi bacterium]|nr:hypothetical protein [Chloroflexota bacterium]